MVSLQSVPSLLATTTTTAKKKKKKKESAAASVVVENSLAKRRKYQDDEEEENEDDVDDRFLTKLPKVERVGTSADIKIGLEDAADPLPLEWQQCLDIKSGAIHFYNTRTNKRTFQDPRAARGKRLPVGGAPCLSLDLKLNLASSDEAPAVSRRPQQHLQREDGNNGEVKGKVKVDDYAYCSKSSSSSSSWISVDADQVEEMVAAVCIRCHMLVMMCKATPSCPNCKFMHPPPPPQPIYP